MRSIKDARSVVVKKLKDGQSVGSLLVRKRMWGRKLWRKNILGKCMLT